MIVRVLGSAAGGGVPQWNCGCANCDAARTGLAPRRSQSSFAVSADGNRWWLVNVSPDIAQQIEAFAPLQPRGTRHTPIAGMLVTDANVDHLGGLAVVRQDGGHRFHVHSSPVVRELAASQPAYAPFLDAPHAWHGVPSGTSFTLDERLDVRVIPVVGGTPGFDVRRKLPDAVVAYSIRDRTTGGVALFAPVFAALDAPLRDAIADAKLALLDGSFWSDDELSDVGMPKPAHYLGHLPVGHDGGSLAALGDLPDRVRVGYAHVNNTNPMLDRDSAAAEALRMTGAFVACDGMEFQL